MIDNTQPENDRFWTDACGLLLFAAGATSSSLLALALTDGPGAAGAATGTAAMGHGLLWIGGAIPVGLMSLACLLMGAGQFLGWSEAPRITRHLSGVLAVSLSLCMVLGAFSDNAGGLVGTFIGGALAGLSSPIVAGLVGMVALCLSVWGAWLSPAKASAWERAQQIERPAVPLQASADGVTTEESAALSFEGAPTAYPGTAASPYPEDVRSRGEIPEGASVIGAEESPKNEENREEQGSEGGADGAAPEGDEDGAEAEEESGALDMEADDSGESVDEHLATVESSSGAEALVGDELQDELVEDAWDTSGSGELEEEIEEPEEAAELQESAEDGASVELEAEEGSSWEELGSEELEAAEFDEEEEEEEWEEEEAEEAAELEEEEEPAEAAELEEEEEEEEWEEEEAAELEEEEEPVEAAEPETAAGEIEGQGDLFAAEDASLEPEVVLEPQSAPVDDSLEASVEATDADTAEGSETEASLLMQAADLFLERDRVAVSLLQRQFNLDFEECCGILDELQEMGLIGPYLGGNRRDILLSREEWLDHVSEMT